MVHFIGKDILYFHALFWPAMLHFAGYRTPNRVNRPRLPDRRRRRRCRSRAAPSSPRESYLQQGLNAEWLRYYYAAKLGSTMEDIDLNLDDFVARVNSDLVGKYVNIAARCSRLRVEALRRAPDRAGAARERLPQSASTCCCTPPRTTSPKPTRRASTARRCARSCGSRTS